ncbi:hypothetical protein BPTFM16_02921 [Altererythrobacter insulae]|nr:hypothetical protein BPTFM16_02921 [Altererythrobacter insulae]
MMSASPQRIRCKLGCFLIAIIAAEIVIEGPWSPPITSNTMVRSLFKLKLRKPKLFYNNEVTAYLAITLTPL